MLLRNSSDLSVSVLAPAVEKVSWRCIYSGTRVVLGVWGLMAARLVREKSNGRQGVLPPAHVMFLHMVAMGDPRTFPDGELRFTTEIRKHMITHFCGLEVHLMTPGHVYEAFLLRLLGMHPFCTAARSLKVVLQRFVREDGCPPHCPCDEPKN